MFLMFLFLIVLDEIIRLLRGFDDEMFLQAYEPELIDEGERLEERNIVIGEWWDRTGCRRSEAGSSMRV